MKTTPEIIANLSSLHAASSSALEMYSTAKNKTKRGIWKKEFEARKEKLKNAIVFALSSIDREDEMFFMQCVKLNLRHSIFL